MITAKKMHGPYLIVIAGLIGLLLRFSSPVLAQTSGKTLKKINTIELPGEKGKRFDYLTIDYQHRYLLSAHLGASMTYVIDLKSEKLLKEIEGTKGVEGIEYVPELNKAYTSDWYERSIGVIDLQKLALVKKIPAIDKPDGSAYATPFHKLYVSDERAKTLIVVDVIKDEVVNKITFRSETGMPQYDSVSRKIYVNLQDLNLFAVIDPMTDNIEGTYTVGECTGNHGMALDQQNRLAFLVCEESDKLAVFSLDSHKTIATVKIPSGGDVVKFDPGLNRIYVACYDGYISVIHEDSPTHFTKLEDFKVQPKVHSLAVDLLTHRVYAPEQEEDGNPVSRMVVYEAIH